MPPPTVTKDGRLVVPWQHEIKSHDKDPNSTSDPAFQPVPRSMVYPSLRGRLWVVKCQVHYSAGSHTVYIVHGIWKHLNVSDISCQRKFRSQTSDNTER